MNHPFIRKHLVGLNPASMKACHAARIAYCILALVMVLTPMSRASIAAMPPALEEQLIDAAKKGNVALVKSLLDRGAQVNAKDEIALTPLRWAVLQRRPAVVALLIDKGADVNEKDAGGLTALMEAAAKGYSDVVQVLLDKGADVNATDKDGKTALMRAAAFASLEVVKLLIERGARVNVADKKGGTALISSAYNRPEVVELLLAKGADVNAMNKSRMTPLSIAALEGKLENLRLLIEKGANVDVVTEDGSTPLMIAASNGNVRTAKLLIEKGADVNARDKIGTTPLMMAAQGGHLPIVRLLLKNGADPKIVSKYKRTALGLAEAYGYYDVGRYLRTHGPVRASASQARKGVLEYPATPKGVVEAFANAALADVPIAVEEMTFCSDVSRIQRAYLPNDEDMMVNHKTHVIDVTQPWGPFYKYKWPIVTGFTVKNVKNEGERKAAVTVLYRRLGWMGFNPPYDLQITNDTQEVTYDLAKPGKFWRIVDAYQPRISVSSAIKILKCEMRKLPELQQTYPLLEERITKNIGTLKQYLDR